MAWIENQNGMTKTNDFLYFVMFAVIIVLEYQCASRINLLLKYCYDMFFFLVQFCSILLLLFT